jgi:anti-sigma B factor antagonist
VLRIAVSGELDIASAPRLRDVCARPVHDGGVLVVLDLTGVTFLDSTGLHALIDAHETPGERLRIVVGPAAARVIDIAQLRDRLPITDA